MKTTKQKVLLFGLGYFGQGLLEALSPQWNVTAVDNHEQNIKRLTGEFPDTEFHHDPADSRLTWKKLDLNEIKYIVSTIRDNDVNLEICKIARKTMKLKTPLIILDFGNAEKAAFDAYNAVLINPIQAGIQVVLKQFDKNISYAVNVGLGKGELIEVEIKTCSHLVGRRFKQLKPTHWHISALYRNGKLIIPDGNSFLKVGDRVVLMGDPKVLENVASILIKGEPQFPLQYGSEIVFPLHSDFEPNMMEAIYWHNTFESVRMRFLPFKKKLSHSFKGTIKSDVQQFEIGETIEMFREIFMLKLDTGVLVVPADRGVLKTSRLRETFKKSRKPFLLSRLGHPYHGVTISMNGPNPAQVLESGIEMVQMMNTAKKENEAKIPYRVIYVTLAKEMRGHEEESRRRHRVEVIEDYEGIYRETIEYIELEGNPVRETLNFLDPRENELLIISVDPDDPISIFNPNVPYHIAKTTHLSTLVIPEAQSDE